MKRERERKRRNQRERKRRNQRERKRRNQRERKRRKKTLHMRSDLTQLNSDFTYCNSASHSKYLTGAFNVLLSSGVAFYLRQVTSSAALLLLFVVYSPNPSPNLFLFCPFARTSVLSRGPIPGYNFVIPAGVFFV